METAYPCAWKSLGEEERFISSTLTVVPFVFLGGFFFLWLFFLFFSPFE